MTEMVPSSYFTPPQTLGEVKWDDGIITVILFHFPNSLRGSEIWVGCILAPPFGCRPLSAAIWALEIWAPDIWAPGLF